MSICILTKYLGAVWAAKILKDWGCNVYSQSSSQEPTIVVIDQNTTAKLPKTTYTITLTDVNVSSPHLLALSGVMSVFGQKEDVFVPKFLVQTVVSNALAILCLQKLYDFKMDKNPKQENLSVSIINTLKYFGAFNISAKANGLLNKPRGQNMLQGGAPFYSVYPCKQGHIVVGNLQPKFYEEMVRGLDLSQQERQFLSSAQFQTDSYPRMRELLGHKFLLKTAQQWEQHYKAFDTCITQIRSPFKSNVIQPKITPLSPKL